MKKLLIATAALAMVAGSAQAQSSVTVYGVLDIAIEEIKSTTNAGVSTNATTQKGTNNNATSVIGLKGTEDLGGGLKAMFDLQGNFNTNTGVAGTTTDAASTNLFDRQSWVGLSHDKYGIAKIGRTSDVLDSVEGYANFTQFFDTETASANGLGNKNANIIRYDSPNIAGVTFAASYSSDATAAGTTPVVGTTNNTNTTYGINYTQGNLTVGAATGEANVANSALRGKLEVYYAGYNFGFADVRVQQTTNKAISATVATEFVEFKTTELSAAFPMPMLGNGVTLVAHYEEADHSTQAGRVAAEKDYKQMGLFVKKDLSKRTTIYAGYRDRDVLGTAAGIDTKTVATGITHSF